MNMKKNYVKLTALSLSMLIAAPTFAAPKSETLIEYGGGYMFVTKISDNGRYAVGMESFYTGLVWDITNNKYEYLIDPLNTSAETVAWDISDNGIVVGDYDDQAAIFQDGVFTKLECPAGTVLGSASAITPDGKTIAGWTSTSGAKPCLWIDGVYTALDTPEVDDQGLKPQWVKAEQISADASVVTGIIRANVGYYTLGTIWRAPEYKAEMLFNDSLAINGGTWDFYTILNVSANSEWICGGVALPNPSDATTYIVYPYRYNLKTETIEIVKEVEAFPGLGDGGAVAIDDNGTLYSPCDAGNPWERDSYIIPVGSSAINTFDYLEQEFEDTTLLNSEVVTTGVCAATPDGSVICGNGSTLEANLAWVVYKKEALSVNSVSTERNSIYLNGNTVYGVNEIGRASCRERVYVLV